MAWFVKMHTSVETLPEGLGARSRRELRRDFAASVHDAVDAIGELDADAVRRQLPARLGATAVDGSSAAMMIHECRSRMDSRFQLLFWIDDKGPAVWLVCAYAAGVRVKTRRSQALVVARLLLGDIRGVLDDDRQGYPREQ